MTERSRGADRVECPVCHVRLFLSDINDHLDKSCSREKRALAANLQRPPADRRNVKRLEASIDESGCLRSDGCQASQPQSVTDLLRPKFAREFKKRRVSSSHARVSGCLSLFRNVSGNLDTVLLPEPCTTVARYFGSCGDCNFYADVPEDHTTRPMLQDDSAESLDVPLSICKSVLQKAIRRGRPLVAVRLSYLMMQRNFVEFIRRLCIIIIEDVMLHPDYGVLVWMMGASSVSVTNGDVERWKPDVSHFDFLARLVYQLSVCPKRDVIPFGSELSGIATDEQSVCKLTNPERTLVHALNLRAEFGGMGCDVRMLRHASLVWANRFSSDSSSYAAMSQVWSCIRVNALNLDKYRILTASNVRADLATWEIGVDHHISNVIDVLISDPTLRMHLQSVMPSLKSSDLPEMFGRAIWDHRSSVNCRTTHFSSTDLPKNDDSFTDSQLWTLMEPFVQRFSRQFLYNRIPKLKYNQG